jgi:hypothetical protein
VLNTDVVEAFDAVVCVVFVGNGVKRSECQLIKSLTKICAHVRVSMRNSLSHQRQRISVGFWRQTEIASGAIRHNVAKKQRQNGSIDVTR